jgi:hypothetical protein
MFAIHPLTKILQFETTHGLLRKIRRRGTILSMSIYADDVAIFVAPIKQNIENPPSVLKGFGEVTRLCKNFQKSSVMPIQSGEIDLDDIINGIPEERAALPIKHLGLRRVDFQHLVDKAADECNYETCLPYVFCMSSVIRY